LSPWFATKAAIRAIDVVAVLAVAGTVDVTVDVAIGIAIVVSGILKVLTLLLQEAVAATVVAAV
jgi:hypothetical protein